MKAVILISGNGSNLQSIIDNASKIDLQICCVISNKEDAFGLKRAKKANIDCIFIDPLLFDSKFAFDKELISVIDQHNVEVIILAGFMRILSSDFVSKFFGKILNIHPSLLPKFPGLNTHQKAIESSEKIHGTSVHFVTVKLDGGPVIAKESVSIDPKDDATTLAKKVLQKEHILYPKVIQWYTQKRLKLIDESTAILDGRVL
jgi:phosphoribosylglycinamide formyltransferase-1